MVDVQVILRQIRLDRVCSVFVDFLYCAISILVKIRPIMTLYLFYDAIRNSMIVSLHFCVYNLMIILRAYMQLVVLFGVSAVLLLLLCLLFPQKSLLISGVSLFLGSGYFRRNMVFASTYILHQNATYFMRKHFLLKFKWKL